MKSSISKRRFECYQEQSEMNSPPMKHIMFMPYQLRPTLSIIQRSAQPSVKSFTVSVEVFSVA
jgi:hypothetical protein